MATKYRTDYQIREWNTPQQLGLCLNDLVNSGWRVDTHKLGVNDTGWTIFSKTVVVKQELSSCEIPTTVVWDALNSTEFYNLFHNADTRDTVSRFISDRVKKFCEKWTKDYEYN